MPSLVVVHLDGIPRAYDARGVLLRALAPTSESELARLYPSAQVVTMRPEEPLVNWTIRLMSEKDAAKARGLD